MWIAVVDESEEWDLSNWKKKRWNILESKRLKKSFFTFIYNPSSNVNYFI